MTTTPGPTDDQVLPIGRAVADALLRRNFRQACTLFGPALLEALPPKALETVWESTEERFGLLGQTLSTKVVRTDRVSTVTRASFEKGFADIVVTFGDDGDVSGLSVVPARGPGELGDVEDASIAATRRRITRMLPVLVVLAAALWFAALALGERVVPRTAWWGATGWTFTMLARAPLSAIVSKRLPPVRAARALQIGGGVIEEALRIGIVAWQAQTFSRAVSVAFGWAAVELVYGGFAAFIAVRLASGSGDRAELARMQLLMVGQQAGSGRALEIAERAVAGLYQVGATLLIAAAPILGVMLMPIRGWLEGAPAQFGVEHARIARTGATVFLLVAGLTAHGRL